MLGDRLLPVIVGAMAFLAALSLGGALAAQALAEQWRLGAGSALTAQVLRPDEPVGAAAGAPSRLVRSLELLRASPAIAQVRQLSPAEVDELLKPWLGAADTVPQDLLPAIVAVRAGPGFTGDEAVFDRLGATLEAAVPGASLESHAAWAGRLSRLLRALEACGWGALLLVVGVATLAIVAATRAGLVARRSTVDILHGLGATDGYVAARFARRAMALAAGGGMAGTLLGVPVLVELGRLAGSLTGIPGEPMTLPTALWIGLVVLPLSAAMIGYATALGTVRLWLRQLP